MNKKDIQSTKTTNKEPQKTIGKTQNPRPQNQQSHFKKLLVCDAGTGAFKDLFPRPGGPHSAVRWSTSGAELEDRREKGTHSTGEHTEP